MIEAKITPHCWTGRRGWIEETYGLGSQEWIDSHQEEDSTCMLLDGHEGPHEWVPDSDIMVEFSESTREHAS